MLYEKNIPTIGKSKFVDNLMILYTTVNLIKMMDIDDEGVSLYEDDELTAKLLEVTFKELFKSVLKMNNGIWN